MGSIVLELQQELLNKDCDILLVLRKAHLIASKLRLTEFDTWIQSELNGYETDQDGIPDYRQIHGQLKAWNPYHGWIPVVLQDAKLENLLCNRKLGESIGEIQELYDKSKGNITLTFTADVANTLDSMCDAPFRTNYSLHVSKHCLKSIIDKVTNSLMEWTLDLERNGILGENMTFNEKEAASAKEMPKQINNYYGTVVNGSVNSSQIASGNNNTVTYNSALVSDAIQEIRDSLNVDEISLEEKETAIEILEDISSKLEQNKKPGIIKSAFLGLKDFMLAAGADITAALIVDKIQELF